VEVEEASTGGCFDVERRDVDGCTTVSLQGELDLAGRPGMDAVIDQLMVDGGECIVFDVHDLEFVEAHSLARWAVLAQSLKARGGELILREPRPIVTRVLTLMGIRDAFAYEPREDRACQ
jgi:anti-anti-sigma factor